MSWSALREPWMELNISVTDISALGAPVRKRRNKKMKRRRKRKRLIHKQKKKTSTCTITAVSAFVRRLVMTSSRHVTVANASRCRKIFFMCLIYSIIILNDNHFKML